jgi:hypothetical protein
MGTFPCPSFTEKEIVQESRLWVDRQSRIRPRRDCQIDFVS